jgi:hypothetical protein
LNPARIVRVRAPAKIAFKGAKLAGVSWKTVGAVEFAETAARNRAASYRERAAHLSVMADAEPVGSLRTQLLDLATRYEEMAENLDIPRDG